MDLPQQWQNTQRRYVAYCVAEGSDSPDGMLAKDRARYPGGVMTGFIIWIDARWREWKTSAKWQGPILSEEDHAAFDEWLQEKVLRGIALPARKPEASNCSKFFFHTGPHELSNEPAIYADSPTGGDPLIVCTIGRIHRQELLAELCRGPAISCNSTPACALKRAERLRAARLA